MNKNKVKVGSVVHTNDKYFYGSDGYSKDRESVVLGVNEREELALAKLTTRPKYPKVPSYNNYSRYEPKNLYTRDNKGKPIVITDGEDVDDLHKFVRSAFPDITEQSVDRILNVILNDKRFADRNNKRFKGYKKTPENELISLGKTNVFFIPKLQATFNMASIWHMV